MFPSVDCRLTHPDTFHSTMSSTVCPWCVKMLSQLSDKRPRSMRSIKRDDNTTTSRCYRRCNRWTTSTSTRWQKPWIPFYSVAVLIALCLPISGSSSDDSVIDQQQQQPSHNTSFTRCYCNMPSCVQTGYMCKSTSGACFAQLSLNGIGTGHAHILYACAEQLPADMDRRACLLTAGDAGRVSLRRRGLPSTDNEVDQWAETVCCATDMCNYYYFRSTGNIEVPDANGETETAEEKHRSLMTSLTAKTTPTPSSFRLSTMAMAIIAASLGVALLFSVCVATVVLRARSVDRFSRRTVWPPTPLLSATMTSASMIEPLFKTSTVTHETVGYVQLLRDRPASCPHRCRQFAGCGRDAGCSCCCRCCFDTRSATSGGSSTAVSGISRCQRDIVCHCTLQASSSGVNSFVDRGAPTTSLAGDIAVHIPSKSSSQSRNKSLRFSGDGNSRLSYPCNSYDSEDVRTTLPDSVETRDVTILLAEESTNADVTVVSVER